MNELERLKKETKLRGLGSDFLFLGENFYEDLKKLHGDEIQYIMLSLYRYVGDFQLKKNISCYAGKGKTYKKYFYTKDKKKKLLFEFRVSNTGGFVVTFKEMELVKASEKYRKRNQLRFNTELLEVENDIPF